MHELVKASADLLESRCAAIDLHYQRFPNTSDRTMEDTAKAIRCILEALRLSSGGQGSSAARIPTEGGSFQSRVLPWLMECFGAEIAGDVEERCDRFIEEALEQAQSLDWPKERAHALVEYVYGRPKGEPHQEAGGVMVTFAALCQAAGLDMTQAGDDELARIMRPEIVLKIRAKQAAKPTGSALPIATSQVGTDEQSEGVHDES